jgi:hypothetical protein
MVFQASPACGKENNMKLLYRRCAGLDVHKKSITACVCIRRNGQSEDEIAEQVFGTFTHDLERLATWLKQQQVKQVVWSQPVCTGFRCGTFSSSAAGGLR